MERRSIARIAWLSALLVAACADPRRPSGTGEVGIVTVYAQTAEGPRALRPGREVWLPRPQALAFELSAAGTGPRLVRVEVDDGARRPVHEVKLAAPLDRWSLDWVARFGEAAPDRVTLHVVVEAPHDRPRRERYPLRFVGVERPFGAPGVDSSRVD